MKRTEASAETRKEKKEADEKRILGIEPVTGKHRTLVVDPPWDYEWLSLAGRAAPGYATMTHEELLALDINRIHSCFDLVCGIKVIAPLDGILPIRNIVTKIEHFVQIRFFVHFFKCLTDRLHSENTIHVRTDQRKLSSRKTVAGYC